jgi:hypothetical protein
MGLSPWLGLENHPGGVADRDVALGPHSGYAPMILAWDTPSSIESRLARETRATNGSPFSRAEPYTALPFSNGTQ